ncbi:MAG: efflux RND transporter periplasmic adaptor subunit [Bryobacterales bacterium]|nr:efflux RND transporter periplasmic adaptor subunit [Bryobacterales bacterium]
MKKVVGLMVLALVGAGVWYVYTTRNAPPEVSVVTPQRERLVSAVATNGKVEPLEWTVVRAPRDGMIVRMAVEKGQQVAAGAVLAELDASDARRELASAEARIAQMKAELDKLAQVGSSTQAAEIEAAAARARVEREQVQRQIASLERLVEKKAATRFELQQAKDRESQLATELRALERKAATLVQPQDREAAQARLREAEVTADGARRRIELSVIRAPLGGVVYQLDARNGAFVRMGDAIGEMGKLEQVRVKVFVDEPELGNVRAGQTVTITWDALVGKQWQGTVERLPSQIAPLGSRQVGEVQCVIENAERLLLPQTNVNAEIRTNVVENALTIPKEVLRREKNESGVFVLEGDKVRWRKVVLGVASVTRLEVKEGLRGGERLVLPTDLLLTDGMTVKPTS